VKFTVEGEDYEVAFVGGCNAGLFEFDEPLTIEEGETVIVNLKYNIENSIVRGTGTSSVSACVNGTNAHGADRFCFNTDHFSFEREIDIE
jgi:hypothetical protein